jgi:hypothetical protein
MSDQGIDRGSWARLLVCLKAYFLKLVILEYVIKIDFFIVNALSGLTLQKGVKLTPYRDTLVFLKGRIEERVTVLL